jgi:uncharacterized protein YoaH (UPF0181 family)
MLLLFSLGTVFPLVIISLLPILALLGGGALNLVQIGLLLSISLLSIYLFSNWVLRRRPPIFSSLELPPTKGRFSPLYCIAIFIVIGAPGLICLLGWIPGVMLALPQGFNLLTLVWALGISISIYCYGSSSHRKRLRDEMTRIEEEILDAVHQIGSRMAEGRSAEEAIEWTSKSLRGTSIARILERASQLIRRQGLTLEEAFFDDKKVHSKKARSIFRALVNSSKRGIKACSQSLSPYPSTFPT